jgi:hypothetical protein
MEIVRRKLAQELMGYMDEMKRTAHEQQVMLLRSRKSIN